MVNRYDRYQTIVKTEARLTMEIEIKKTVREWEKHFDTFVLDYDGFPQDTDANMTLFTEEEFLENVKVSTVKFSEKLTKALHGR